MNTQVKHIYVAAAVVGVLIVAAIIAHAYIASGRDVAAADSARQVAEQQTKQLRAELAVQLAKIEADKKQAVTPQIIVQKIPEYITLPQPPQLRTVDPSNVRRSICVEGKQDSEPFEAASNNFSKLPDAPSQGLYFPEADVKPLFDHLADCKANELKLAECKTENSLLTTRAEFAEKAMKGGGFWSRLKSNGKWFIIGGVAGAAAVAARR